MTEEDEHMLGVYRKSWDDFLEAYHTKLKYIKKLERKIKKLEKENGQGK